MAAMKLVAAVGDQDEGAHPRQPASDVVEQLPSRVIGPMNVLDHEQQRRVPAAGIASSATIASNRRSFACPESPDCSGPTPSASCGKSCESSRRGGPEALRAIASMSASVEVVADRLDERQVRQRELGLAATAGEHRRSEPSRLADQLIGKPGLADPRFPGDDDEPAAAPPRLQQRVLERGKRLLPTNQDWGDDGAGHGLNSLSGRR